MSDSIVELAQNSEYEALYDIVKDSGRRKELKTVDAYNMTVLHWICTEKNVPLKLVKGIVKVFPKAVGMKNGPGFLPLHIALKGQLPLEVIVVLVEAMPESVMMKVSSGENAIEMGKNIGCETSILNYLRKPKEGLVKKESVVYSEAESSEASTSMENGPVKWQNNTKCHICDGKFGFTKKRHHCRSCGMSVCHQHSNRKAALIHLGLEGMHRVCLVCFDELDFSKKNTSKKKGKEDVFANQHDEYARENGPNRKRMDTQMQEHETMEEHVAKLENIYKELVKTKRDAKDALNATKEDIAKTKELKSETENTIAQLEYQQAQKSIADTTISNAEDPGMTMRKCAIHHYLAQALMGKEEYMEAIVEINHSLDIDDTDAEVWYSLGKAHFALKEYDDAVDAANEALRRDANLKSAQVLLEQIELEQRDTESSFASSYESDCSSEFLSDTDNRDVF